MHKWVGRTVHIHASFTNTNDFEFNMNLRVKSLANYQKHWLFLCFNKPKGDLALLPWLGGYGIKHQKKKMPWSLRLETNTSIDFCYGMFHPSEPWSRCPVLFFWYCILYELKAEPSELKENSTLKPRYPLPVPRVKLTSRTWMKWQSSECGDTPGVWESQTLPQGFFHQVTKTESMLNKNQHRS